MLEKSVAQVNTFFMDYNLMLGVINVGSLVTKTKLNIPMLYFDTSQCRVSLLFRPASVRAKPRM